MSEPALWELALLEWRHRSKTVTLDELRALRAQAPDAFDEAILSAEPDDLEGLIQHMTELAGIPLALPVVPRQPPKPARRPTYGTCPLSVGSDERLDGDDGTERAFLVAVLVWCDDWGRFEGDAEAFAREAGMSVPYVEARMAALEARGVIARYEAPGRRRLVGEVLGFGSLPGQPDRRVYVSRRGAGLFPDRDGQVPLPRRARPPRRRRRALPPDASSLT